MLIGVLKLSPKVGNQRTTQNYKSDCPRQYFGCFSTYCLISAINSHTDPGKGKAGKENLTNLFE